MKISKEKNFLIIVSLTLFSVIIIYILVYLSIVKEKEVVSTSYKDFLIKNTHGHRLIAESGSNVHHAINSRSLKEEFNMLTINLGDNAVIPLKLKLRRIQQYAHQGDIILIPLGWPYFSTHKLYKGFSNNIFDTYRYYFHLLSIKDKFELIIQTPFSSLLYGILNQNTDYESALARDGSTLVRLYEYTRKFHNNEVGDSNISASIMIRKSFKEKNPSCDKYIFHAQIKYGFIISDTFKENMQIIKEIEKKGVKFVFTWPAIVGDDCYKSKYATKIYNFADQVEKYMFENNFTILGEMEDSLFPDIYRYDTYAHVIPEARNIRTERLIKRIQESPYNSYFTENNSSMDFTLSTDLETLHNNVLAQLEPLKANESIYFDSKRFKYRSVYLDGWYEHETWGIWTRGNSSKITIRLDNRLLNNDISIVIKSHLFHIKDMTQIYIGDIKLGDYLLDGKSEIVVPKKILTKSLLTITLKNKNVQSPFDLNQSSDNRKIKVGMESLVLKYN